MDTVKLAALLTAAELGSISKAAEALGYTQSGVTHIINSLEEEAGFPLLVRGNRGVRFTAEGERLAPFIREVVQAAATLAQEAALTRGLERGTVRVGTYSSISLRWMPRILEAFQERYPGIAVELLEGNGPEMEEWLSTGRIDIAFTSLQPHFNFETIRIQDDPMMAVLPRTHPMANAEVFPVGRFKGEPFLVYMTSSNQPDEDLAEIISTYITNDQAYWDSLLEDAGEKGAGLITQKLELVRTYLQDSWQIDIDHLRDVVLRRSAEIKDLDLDNL